MYATYLFLALLSLFKRSDGADDCSSCKEVIKGFIQGVEKTTGASFNGGNTLWEEKKLINYAVSETRFHSILDDICTGSNFQCQKTLHEIEPLLDDWWTTVFKANPDKTENMEYEICVKSSRLCCPVNTYGKECLPCSPCSEYGGNCDGNGSRSGNGSCVCKHGYAGPTCDSCNTQTHFPLNSTDGTPLCEPCHPSCEGGCHGPDASDCKACAKGWYLKTKDDATVECEDVDECQTSPCKPTQFCENTLGSYSCKSCSKECDGCTGPTNADCLQCAQGYSLTESRCEDIDECKATSNPCSLPGEVCRNTKGGYKCDCKSGWNRVQGLCVPQDSADDEPLSDVLVEKDDVERSEL